MNDNITISLDNLVMLCRDIQVDCFDGFVSNDKSYIENWLKINKIDRMNWNKLSDVKPNEGDECVFWFGGIDIPLIAKYDYKIDALGATHWSLITPPTKNDCCEGYCKACDSSTDITW